MIIRILGIVLILGTIAYYGLVLTGAIRTDHGFENTSRLSYL